MRCSGGALWHHFNADTLHVVRTSHTSVLRTRQDDQAMSHLLCRVCTIQGPPETVAPCMRNILSLATAEEAPMGGKYFRCYI